MTTTTKILTGFIIGATTGALIGVLFAPKKGAKTRARMMDKTRHLANELTRGYDTAKNMIGLQKKEAVSV